MNFGQLKELIVGEPETLALWEAGDNGAIVDWFNEPDKEDVAVSSITKKQYMVFALPVLAAAMALPADQKEKWVTLINFGTKADTIDVSLPEIRALFLEAVTAGLVTSEKVTSLIQRRGSRAEKIFGQNLSLDDVRAAREVK